MRRRIVLRGEGYNYKKRGIFMRKEGGIITRREGYLLKWMDNFMRGKIKIKGDR